MALRLVSVTRRFGNQLALDSVSLHVRAGDCYGFLGHNGAGKTTALRIALGLQRPDAGRVLVEGFDAAEHPREARARMGGLVESPGFHDGMAGVANLALLGRVQGFDRRTARTEAGRVLDAVGLGTVGAKPVRAWSQGMRQRLGIAQALYGRPRIVLLDEPTNGLDPEGLDEIRRLLVRLTREEGTTVLLSSHQLHDVAGICTRVGILREGRLLVEEETSQLLAGTSSTYGCETADDAKAAAVLAQIGVSTTAVPGGGLAADLGAHPPPEVLRELVSRGVEVRAFAPRPATLEEIYLRITRDGARPASVAPPPPEIAAASAVERRAPRFPALRALRYEVERWTSAASVPLLLLLPALAAVGAVLQRRADAARDAAEMAGGTLISATRVTAFEGVAVALGAALPLLAFITAGVASQSLAGELARGTLRNLLLRPVRRVDVAVGKACATVGAALVGYAALALAAVAVSAAVFDFTDVSEILPNGVPFVLVRAEELRPELLRVLLLVVSPVAAYAGLGFLAGAITRSGAGALALSLGGATGLELSRAYGRDVGLEAALLPAHLPSPLSDTSYVKTFLDRSQGVSNATDASATAMVLVPLAWAVVTFAAGAWLLRRRDVP